MANPYVGENGWPKPYTAKERRRLAKLDGDRNVRPNEEPSGQKDASPDFAAGMRYGDLKRQRHAPEVKQASKRNGQLADKSQR